MRRFFSHRAVSQGAGSAKLHVRRWVCKGCQIYRGAGGKGAALGLSSPLAGCQVVAFAPIVRHCVPLLLTWAGDRLMVGVGAVQVNEGRDKLLLNITHAELRAGCLRGNEPTHRRGCVSGRARIGEGGAVRAGCTPGRAPVFGACVQVQWV